MIFKYKKLTTCYPLGINVDNDMNLIVCYVFNCTFNRGFCCFQKGNIGDVIVATQPFSGYDFRFCVESYHFCVILKNEN